MIQISTVFGYDVDIPQRGSDEAAGIDVFLPRYNEMMDAEFRKMNDGAAFGRIATPNTGPYIHIGAHQRVILPTGLRIKVEPGTYIEVANRGSMAAKYGLVFGAHIIDSDYRGVVFINLINTGNTPQQIDFGQKIAQLIHKPVLMSEIQLVSDEEFSRKTTKRGAGALGSTGR